ncbi:membrane-bound PQQ-dependent dehydrogenase, glucose/quinate/shikimate family [Pusillimonas sp. SM2304]|uniref:membrane-bound PQQ-dependent dehydrogenase, glucose/quinate/shikimate family n=1 Tax=Pusillimonas sp. SM2304 TaxID=3073241 RepID=UPI0028751904|nr:membrane-bound PQQ-dependent dehydrogenase, glucose/quinate/shikimate family [Pusillimonas sp. SM2304]MDS1139044.1 membrane-bound PQQ-dependent dehydrogenase, glucose/quinate/shikimate family [Pusillimonas sp. SM2304]
MSATPKIDPGLGRIWLYLLALGLLAAGLFLAIGGALLIARGGSRYFLIAGVVIIASSIQVALGRSAGAWLFLASFAGTVLWALYDVGLEYWGLISRLLAMTFLACVVAFTLPLLRKTDGSRASGKTGVIAGIVLGLLGLAGFGSMFIKHPEVVATAPAAQSVPVAPDQEQKNWAHYGNDAGTGRFAALDQINVANVDQLAQAWVFQTGDIPESTGAGAEDQLTPMQIGDKLFLCTPKNNVIALDVDSGKQLWRRDFNAGVGGVWERCRGLAYFDANAPVVQPTAPGSSPVTPVTLPAADSCQRRVLMNTIDARLVAINSDNGEMCGEFGDHGIVDLKAGMGAIANKAYYTMTAAPTVAGTTIVVGGRVADNVQVDMPGGVVRGFDVITGQMRWHFDPGMDDPNAPLADDGAFQRSTPNVWAGISYDPAMNTVFLPVGSASVDLYGVTRTALDKKYGASVLALDASTGKEKWLYQTVRNDLWDFDVPMAPALIDFPIPGGKVAAVVVATKAGQIFVLDRQTGQPLTPVEERDVLPAGIPGEDYAKTQPVSVGMPQIGTQTLTEADMWGATLFDQLLCRIDFKAMRYEGLFTAPDTDVSLSYPGSLGGMNWGGISHDPNNDLIFVNDMRLGLWVRMMPQQAGGQISDGGEAPNTGMGQVPLGGTPYAVIKDRFLSPLGIPCQKPPFGTMTAIDLKTQKIAWEVPVGTVQDTGPMGIKMQLPFEVGMPTLGASLATQGGLLFFAGTQDYYLRAFDTASGKEVWKQRLPVGSQGGPITYKSPKTGKQYVVISAGGARQSPDRGDYVIAYALRGK